MSQRKIFAQLVSGSGVATLANAVAALLATRWLPIDDRGVMVAALTAASIPALASGLGTGAALRALWPIASPAERSRLDCTYRVLTVWGIVLGALLAAVACLVLAPVIDPRLGGADVVAAAALMAAYLVALRQVTEAWFARGGFAVAARISAVSAASGLLALVVVGMTWAGTAQLITAQAAGSSLVLVAFVIRAGRVGDGLAMDRLSARQLLRLGASGVGMPLGSAVVLRSDRIILAALAGPQYLAVYALAATASEAARLGPAALAQMGAHRVANDSSIRSIQGLYVRSTAFVVGVGATMVILSFVVVPPVFGPGYSSAVPLIAIMTVGEIGYGCFIIASMGLLGGGWGGRSTATAVVAAIVCLPAYGLGSAVAGPVGCAVASALLYLIMGAVAASRLRVSLTARLRGQEDLRGVSA